MAGILTTPRPMPSLLPPLVAGAAVIALALPLFVVAGWPLAGWLIGALLWAGSRAAGAPTDAAQAGRR